MSYHQTATSCCLNTNFDELRWVLQIRRAIEEEIEYDTDIHVSVFTVPKALKDTNPNAYTPQLVAIGPYHCWRSELQEMERYKISSVKRFQSQIRDLKFHNIVDRLIMLEPRIRASYHKYLNINDETLAWMMAIDTSFLLEVVSTYGIKEGKLLTEVSSRNPHLVDYTRRKSTHNAILRDIIMLENQIPLFVLREMLRFQLSSSDLVEKTLLSILTRLYKDLSPFKVADDLSRTQTSSCEHVLDFFYHIIVPTTEDVVEVASDCVEESDHEDRRVCKLVLQLKEYIQRIPLRNIFKLPWIFVSNLPGFAILRIISFSEGEHQENVINDVRSRTNKNNSPLVEEIMIPSVVELSNSGITFLPTNGDITSIHFDAKEKKFYLPTISLDLNSEVVLRNLVAYEASNESGPLVFTRYTELMNGIIDTKEDVKLLRERGIMLNYLKSDEEVANLWNGMTKSLRLTRVPFLDEVIENVNKYYEGNWKVRIGRLFTAYAANSWQILAFFATILLFFLLILQTFRSIFFYSHMVGAHGRS